MASRAQPHQTDDLHPAPDPDRPADELVAGDDDGDDDTAPASGLPAWFISGGLHGAVALIFCGLVFAGRAPDLETPPMQVPVLAPPTVDKQVKPPVELTDKVPVNIETPADVTAPITTIDTVELTPSSDEDTEAEVNKGREEAVAVSETGGEGAFMAIGAGGGGSGALGNRKGGGKHKALMHGGGSRPSEAAVNEALRWFKRHQSENGMWDAEKYNANCQDNPKCEPGSLASSGGSDVNAALTGYALLCFLGAGNDHNTPGPFRATVQKGLDYLRTVQKPDGLIGVRNYEHAVATMALAEAYAMTSDQSLHAPAQKGVDVILARQAKDSAKNADQAYAGLGWDYVEGNPTRQDSSVSGWCVMALKSAVAAQLKVGKGMEGARTWLDKAWKAANKDWRKLNNPYTATSSFPYTWDSTSDVVQIDPPGSSAHDLAPVGAVCAVFLDHNQGDIMLESLCNHIDKYQRPVAYPCNTYYMYYNTMAVFQAGGERWKRWNATVRDMLVKAMRTDSTCFKGSWDPAGTVFHGSDTGRVLSTAYCCLCLEVYYRYKTLEDLAPAKPALH